MSNRAISKIIWVSVAVLLVAWDVVPFMDPVRGDTLSEVLAKWGLKMFSLPMMFGVLCGHFFFLRDNVRQKPRVLLPIGAGVIGADVLSRVLSGGIAYHLQLAQAYPWVWCLVGIPLGALLWPQSKSDKV